MGDVVLQTLIQQSDQLLKELADRLKSPSKMFGFVGPKAPAGDEEKLQACIQNLKIPLHGAIHYRQLVGMLKDESQDSEIKELDAFIGEKPFIAYGVAPYKSFSSNYLMNMYLVINNLLQPEKNVECISFTRIKNLIQNSMKGKNIDLSSLKDQIQQFLSGKEKDAGEKSLLTPARALKDTTTVVSWRAKRTATATAAVNKPLFGGIKKTRKRKSKKTRKSRRV